MITLGDYLIVSGMLFAIGFAGVMLRRNHHHHSHVAGADVERGQFVARRFFPIPRRFKRLAQLQRAGFRFLHHHCGGR